MKTIFNNKQTQMLSENFSYFRRLLIHERGKILISHMNHQFGEGGPSSFGCFRMTLIFRQIQT